MLAPVFETLPPMFGDRDRVLRAAACRLADLGARLHPDHRADLVFEQVLRAPVAGQTHAERAFLAVASFSRHTSASSVPDGATLSRLLSETQRRRARALGSAIRLGCDLSGRSSVLLAQSRLGLKDDRLILSAAEGWSDMLLALGLFGAGFFFRPLGALIFGRIGDKAGRKGAFLITVILMGAATFAIGLLPTYAQAGWIAPVLLILMRIIQGTALGGEYGGAAIYVAEHAPDDKRGALTGWIQTSAAFGLLGALLVILATRTIVGEEAFVAWGWRIPFLVSVGLLGISIWMRMKLSESPSFKKLKDAGEESKHPFRESFGQWKNLKLVLLALVALMFAQGAVWYTTFFYLPVFLERFLKVEPKTVNMLVMIATAVSAPLAPAIRQSSVVVDFTAPGATLAALEACISSGTPIVIGTT
eukprot:gene41388-55987_t